MRSFLAVLTAIAILFAVGCSGSDNNQPSEATEEAPHILAVQNAKTGHLTVQGDTYSLTLTGVDDKTVWFTDRPVHDAGAEPTRDLLDKLLDSNEGPPNAAMVWASDDGETTLILELLSAKYDEALGTIVYQARVLDQGDGKLAEFGSSAKVPDGEIAEPALFIDSIFKDEVCELDLYNEVHNPPGEFGYVPEFNVYLVPDDETNKDSGPDGVPTIESGNKLSWKWEADSSIDDCSVYVTLEEASSSTDVISFELYNGSTGGNQFNFDYCNGFDCSWITLTNSATYHMAFFVCESGVGNAACQARAGFGNACKLDIYNYVLNSGNLSLAATFSLEDGTVLQSAPASNLIKSTSHSVSSASWEWAGNSSTTDCGVAATIMNGNTTVAGVKLQNPNSGDSVFQQLLCQGFQCASAVIEDDATYHVAFIVCDSGLTSAACKTRAGF